MTKSIERILFNIREDSRCSILFLQCSGLVATLWIMSYIVNNFVLLVNEIAMACLDLKKYHIYCSPLVTQINLKRKL